MVTILITGASRGIGLELTRQCLKQGFKVIATFRGQPSEQLSELLATKALDIYELEVTDSNSIAAFAKAVPDEKIDILINNAGVIGPDEQSFETLKPDEWVRTFEINTIAPLMICRAFISRVKQSANPRIITVSSQMGAINSDSTGMYAYRSSKAAANRTMKVLAEELKPDGVIVCPIHPGWVRTDMGGGNADISVEESAAGIIKLANDLTLEKSGKFFTWRGDEHVW